MTTGKEEYENNMTAGQKHKGSWVSQYSQENQNKAVQQHYTDIVESAPQSQGCGV